MRARAHGGCASFGAVAVRQRGRGRPRALTNVRPNGLAGRPGNAICAFWRARVGHIPAGCVSATIVRRDALSQSGAGRGRPQARR